MGKGGGMKRIVIDLSKPRKRTKEEELEYEIKQLQITVSFLKAKLREFARYKYGDLDPVSGDMWEDLERCGIDVKALECS